MENMETDRIKIGIAIQNKPDYLRFFNIFKSRPDMKVDFCTDNGSTLVEYTKKYRPDVLILDMNVPFKEGRDPSEIIEDLRPEVKILLLTGPGDDGYIFEAILAGANGFLPNGVNKEELADAIHMVCEQGAMIHPAIAGRVLDSLSKTTRGASAIKPKGDIAKLNQTEIKIIRLIGSGFSNKEIADKLCLSNGTCRNYISEILSKTELRDRTQLAIFAIQKG